MTEANASRFTSGDNLNELSEVKKLKTEATQLRRPQFLADIFGNPEAATTSNNIPVTLLSVADDRNAVKHRGDEENIHAAYPQTSLADTARKPTAPGQALRCVVVSAVYTDLYDHDRRNKSSFINNFRGDGNGEKKMVEKLLKMNSHRQPLS